MKYLIDTQLPKRLAHELEKLGHDAIHTLDLPEGNRTKDRDINSFSKEEKRVVVSKDSDFVDAILLSSKPYKLLFIATGNISNTQLLYLFRENIRAIDEAFETSRLIELTFNSMIIHQ